MLDITQEEIMKNWQGDINQPLVSVQCITYNHENYIAQALDGFLMQKTNFPFEVIVHDDASPDKTADIVREYEKKYPAIIKAIYQTENQYSKRDGTIERIMNEACKGKYIALCEGDDYWIDENKLQMQVDFLEGNPEYGMCYTFSQFYLQKDDVFVTRKLKKRETFGDIIFNYTIPTATIIVVSKKMKEYYDFRNKIKQDDWKVGDYPLSLWFALNSSIKCICIVTSVYRILEKSASHFTSFASLKDFLINTTSIRNYYVENFIQKKYLKERYLIKSENLLNRNLCIQAILYNENSSAIFYWKRIRMIDIKSVIIKILTSTKLFYPIIRKRFS